MPLLHRLFAPVAILALSACGGAETSADNAETSADNEVGEPEAVESATDSAPADTGTPAEEEVVGVGDAAPAAFAQCKACHSTGNSERSMFSMVARSPTIAAMASPLNRVSVTAKTG